MLSRMMAKVACILMMFNLKNYLLVVIKYTHDGEDEYSAGRIDTKGLFEKQVHTVWNI